MRDFNFFYNNKLSAFVSKQATCERPQTPLESFWETRPVSDSSERDSVHQYAGWYVCLACWAEEGRGEESRQQHRACVEGWK